MADTHGLVAKGAYRSGLRRAMIGCIKKGGGRTDVLIPDEVLPAAGMTEAELRRELAILFYQREKLTLAQASRLAGLSRLQFQHLAASRQIPIHHDVAEFEEDLKVLRELGRL